MTTELEKLTEHDARYLTNQIKEVLSVAWHRIAEAYQRRAWEALGYATWDEYCTTEFNGSRLRLPREERREVVASLRESGMSNKSIAAATGMTPMQIGRDAKEAGVTNVTPVLGADGKNYTPRQSDPDIEDAEVVDDEPAEPQPQPAKVEKQERTDVVRVMNQVLVHAEEAAENAEKITREHLARRGEESSVWSRRLAAALDTLHHLTTVMQETAR